MSKDVYRMLTTKYLQSTLDSELAYHQANDLTLNMPDDIYMGDRAA